MKFKKFKEYLTVDNIVPFSMLVVALTIVLSFLITLPIKIITSIGFHQCITFEDGTEYHVKCRVTDNAENIILENGDCKMSILIKDRGYIITDCDCENSVSNLEDIKEKEYENLH